MELAKHLAELHDQSLKDLYDIINGHKICLQGLIQQAQDEVAAVVGASRQTVEGEQAEGEGFSPGEPAPAPGNGKRKHPATAATSAEISQQPKRRGRPRKRPIEPVIEETAEDEEQAAAEQQQESISATLHASTLQADAAAADTDTMGDVKSASEAAASRGRGTRGCNMHAEPAVVATKTKVRRGAAAPAATGRSTRSRRAAAAAAAAAQDLEAIAEEAGQHEHQTQCTQHVAEPMQQQEHHEGTPEQQDTLMGDAAAQAEHHRDQQELGARQQCQPQQMWHAAEGCSQIMQQHSDHQQVEGATAGEQPAPSSPASVAAAAEADHGSVVQALHGAAASTHEAQDSPGVAAGDYAEQQTDEFQLLPSTTAAATNLPNTPGFCLKPSTSKKPESETPCLGRSAGNGQHFQQQAPSINRAAASLPAVVAAVAVPGSADKSAADVSIQRRVLGTAREGGSGLKGHSLSFGQALHTTLFADDADPSAAAAEAAGNEPAAPPTAAPDITETAAAGAADWKAFLSTVHAGDAPTPAHSRQRLQSHSGAASVQQQLQSGRCSSVDMPDAALATASRGRKASNAQQLFQSPTAGVTGASPLVGLASGRKATRHSTQQQQSPSEEMFPSAHVQTSQQSGRGRRTGTPRSAKNSIAASAVEFIEAAATGTTADEEEEQQDEQEVQLPAAEEQQLETAVAAILPDGGVLIVDRAIVPEEEDAIEPGIAAAAEAEAALPGNATEKAEDVADEHLQDIEYQQQVDVQQRELEQKLQEAQNAPDSDQEAEEEAMDGHQDDTVAAAQLAQAMAAGPTGSTAATCEPAAPAAAGKGADALTAWLAATAAASAGVGDKAWQQLEAAKEKAPMKSNLVSGIRSFVPAVAKKEAAPPAAGKVKVKVKAIEAAQAARQAEEARAAEKAARQQQQQQSKSRAGAAAAAVKLPGTPSGAVAQSKVAAVEQAAMGLSGSGGAVRVLASKTEDEPSKPADRDAAQKRAEKEAETAKRAMDKLEREERMKRAEQKRKDEDMKRRTELAEKQRLKEERLAAAAALKGAKPAGGAAVTKAAGVRIAGGLQAAEAKLKPNSVVTAAAAAADPSSYKTPAAPKAAARVPSAAAGTAAGAGCCDSPTLEIKLLDPVSTGGKAAAHGHQIDHKTKKHQHDHGTMGPPAPVEGKTPAPFKTPAPPVSEQEKRNVEALKSSPYVNPGSKRTPYCQQQQQQAASYIISPYREDDVDTPDRSHKPVPDWARSNEVYEAVKAQQHVDPDTIFGARQTTCDLGDMFVGVPGAGPQPHHRHKVRKLGQRTSSADWSKDRLTWQEEINYKKQAGWL